MRLRYETGPTDGPTHQQNIALLQAALIGTSLATFSAQYPGVFDPSDTYTLSPGGSLLPRMTCIDSGTSADLLVILNGMANYDKVAACITGWGDPSYQGDGSIYPYETAANLLAPLVPFHGPGSRWNNVTVIAHSYGGAVATFLAPLIQGVGDATNIKVYTYGAPKSTVLASHGGALQPDTRRVFLRDDPVPCLPLGPEDASNVWAVNGQGTARSWSRWRHSAMGLLYAPALPTLTPASNPPFADTWTLYFSLAGWVTGVNGFGSPKHSLTEYYAAMVTVPEVLVPTVVPITMPAPAPVRPTVQQVQQIQRAAQEQMANVVAANPQDAVIGIISGTPRVPGERFYGRRVSGENRVYYNGNVVAFTRTKGERRSLVRSLNATL